MERIKIRMPASYYEALNEFLNQFNEDKAFISPVNKAVYREFREIIQKTAIKSLFIAYKSKFVSIQLLPSQAIVVFSTFNGSDARFGFGATAMNEICRQIEEQMYKTGKYKLELI